jgi:hypothetical protein
LPVYILALHSVPPTAPEALNPVLQALPAVATAQNQYDTDNLHYRNRYTQHQPSGGKYHNIRGNTPIVPISFRAQARTNPMTDLDWVKAYNLADSRIFAEADRRIHRVIASEITANIAANPKFTLTNAMKNMKDRGEETEAKRISKACREIGYTRWYAIEIMKEVQKDYTSSHLPSWYQDLNP